MGLFDAFRNREERREAAERYEQQLSAIDHHVAPEELASAQDAAAEVAGEHLTARTREDLDATLRTRLSLEAAAAYGDVVVGTPLAAVLDGSWRDRHAAALEEHGRWLTDAHRADQHWQAVEAAFRAALEHGAVDDDAVFALDSYAATVDPDGPSTTDDGWYRRFARARLDAGLLPRPRGTARLITQAGETIVLTEDGALVEEVEYLDSQDRRRIRTETFAVRLEASDQRLAVFAEDLVLSVRWAAVVGVTEGSDDHGDWVRLDDADSDASHVVHAPLAGLVAAMARELHRRSGA